jgi:hypothetical protein
MNAPKNYKELTDKMLQLFVDISNETITIDRAHALVRTSNAIVNIQRAKIQSTRVTGDKEIKFFKD